VVAGIVAAPQPAMANPAMEKKDGSAVRHTTPPALNAYGKKYKGIEK
jgi:hypothetical protein